MAKKTNVKKTVKKEIDINDVDSLVEDMKKLALDKPKEEEKVTFQKTVENENLKKSELNLAETVEPEIKIFDKLVKGDETPTKELKTYEKPVTTVTTKNSDDNDDDLSFIDEIKDEKTIIEEPKQEKQKRKITYQEMFGGTWMGYGYSE